MFHEVDKFVIGSDAAILLLSDKGAVCLDFTGVDECTCYDALIFRAQL